jgi:hypothetical protein
MKRALIGLALAAILPVSAQAGELSYNYIEGNYVNTDFASETFDGFGVNGSVGFGGDWYASASYRKVSNGHFNLDLDETTVNLGWHHAMSDKADFLAEIGYVDMGADFGGTSGSSNGYRAALGFRGMLAPNFEGSIKASYTDVSDMDGEFGIGVGAVYHINPTWGIVGSFDHTRLISEDANTWAIGVRASF